MLELFFDTVETVTTLNRRTAPEIGSAVIAHSLPSLLQGSSRPDVEMSDDSEHSRVSTSRPDSPSPPRVVKGGPDTVKARTYSFKARRKAQRVIYERHTLRRNDRRQEAYCHRGFAPQMVHRKLSSARRPLSRAASSTPSTEGKHSRNYVFDAPFPKGPASKCLAAIECAEPVRTKEERALPTHSVSFPPLQCARDLD